MHHEQFLGNMEIGNTWGIVILLQDVIRRTYVQYSLCLPKISGRQIGGISMNELMSRKKSLRTLLLICAYCNEHKNDDGYWEKVNESTRYIPETRISHGICPQCLHKHFPEEYMALYAEGKIIIGDKNYIGF